MGPIIGGLAEAAAMIRNVQDPEVRSGIFLTGLRSYSDANRNPIQDGVYKTLDGRTFMIARSNREYHFTEIIEKDGRYSFNSSEVRRSGPDGMFDNLFGKLAPVSLLLAEELGSCWSEQQKRKSSWHSRLLRRLGILPNNLLKP